jgi:hypothetical protein
MNHPVFSSERCRPFRLPTVADPAVAALLQPQ